VASRSRRACRPCTRPDHPQRPQDPEHNCAPERDATAAGLRIAKREGDGARTATASSWASRVLSRSRRRGHRVDFPQRNLSDWASWFVRDLHGRRPIPRRHAISTISSTQNTPPRPRGERHLIPPWRALRRCLRKDQRTGSPPARRAAECAGRLASRRQQPVADLVPPGGADPSTRHSGPGLPCCRGSFDVVAPLQPWGLAGSAGGRRAGRCGQRDAAKSDTR